MYRGPRSNRKLVKMAILPTNYDYTSKDTTSLDARMVDLILSVYPDYPVTAANNAGNLFRELYSFMGDVLSLYSNKQSREMFWSTFRQRKSAIKLGKLTTYELSGATAATADVTVTISNGPLGDDLVIPVETIVRTSNITDSIRGEVQAAITITAGNTTGTLSWEHSLSKSATFTSNGNANQEFFLAEGPYIDDSAVVTTSLGTWTEVTNFLNSDANDLDYIITVDQNDKATIRTGDNQNGIIPSGTITVAYKTGGGASGSVAANSLTVIEGTFADNSGNPAILTVTNALAATPGDDRESIGTARVNGPATLTALTRSVARTDFEVHALNVSGVARALMVTSNEISMDENAGYLYIVPVGGGTASTALLTSVETAVTVTYPCTTTFTVTARTSAYLDVDVTCHIWIKTGYAASVVKASVTTALTEFFEPLVTRERLGPDGETLEVGEANPNVDFGFNYKDEDDDPAGEIAWSDVQNTVRDTEGVRKVGSGETEFTLNGQRDDVDILNYQFPRLGTVTIYDGSTGLQL